MGVGVWGGSPCWAVKRRAVPSQLLQGARRTAWCMAEAGGANRRTASTSLPYAA